MKKYGEFVFRGERGSVLMEFLIVLPIYFLFIGYVFVVGELSLHSIRLSASGDRTVAFSEDDLSNDKAEFWRRMRRVLSPDAEAMKKADNDPSEDGLAFSYQGDLVYQGRAGTSSFDELSDIEQKTLLPKNNGRCTVAVAGRAKDDYTLSPITRGFIAHWFYESERHVYDGEGMSKKMDRPINFKDSVDKILDKDRGSLGRTEARGNYYVDNSGDKIRDYGYFSLRVNNAMLEKSGSEDEGEDEDKGEDERKYRLWSPKELANGGWVYAKVYSDEDKEGEALATVNIDPILYISEDTEGGGVWTTKNPGPDDPVDYDFPKLL